MEARTFLLGSIIIANAVYGTISRRTIPKNWLRALLTFLMLVPGLYVTAIWALFYTPLTLYRRRRDFDRFLAERRGLP